MLKRWLIRRRDNPYPSREEKRALAVQTGLTYIQVCNWFANWRRKLKNAGCEPRRVTWGALIKTYNRQAHGNVEHFSICSDDSIWQEMPSENDSVGSAQSTPSGGDHCYSSPETEQTNRSELVDRYLRDAQTAAASSPHVLTKWLQSAANFRPSQRNYLDWSAGRSERQIRAAAARRKHGREELDAAEALTKLAAA